MGSYLVNSFVFRWPAENITDDARIVSLLDTKMADISFVLPHNDMFQLYPRSKHCRYR
jgi:hypothetical protein